ncbi:MAG: hypothetical protein HC841_05455, partial [Verrucomicrobiae bacterium]|nr:hypothetical protein [Verrucomicrobiae bacterium]
HPNAAGATLPRSVITPRDAVDYMAKVLNGARAAGAGLNSLEGLLAGFKPAS